MTSWAEVEAALDALGEAAGPWTTGQVLAHCAQSIECSIDGFPRPRGWLVRRVIGPRVLGKFLRQGFMRHDRGAPIPGAPALGELTVDEGKARLRAAIARFRAHEAALAPHFAYGPVSKADYERVHAMHFADHFRP